MEELRRFDYIKPFLLENEQWKIRNGSRTLGNFIYQSPAYAQGSREKGKDYFHTQDEGTTLVLEDDEMFERYCDVVEKRLKGDLKEYEGVKKTKGVTKGLEQMERAIAWLEGRKQGVQNVQQKQAEKRAGKGRGVRKVQK